MEMTEKHNVSALQARFNKKIAVSVENQFAMLKVKADKFRQHLAENKDILLSILSTYQSHATSEDEFERIFECLDALEEVRHYLTRRTGSVAVFFPLNMPVYALVLYGVFAALVADHVYVRAPQRMTDLMRQLKPVLSLETYFPNLEIVFANRDEFINNHVAYADVVIFTGKLINAQHVMRKCKKDSLFLFNGWGCNPIVVGKEADLDLAAERTVRARLFSSGQDCAGPDTVLVSRKDVDSFVAKVRDQLSTTKIGFYDDKDVIVGPLSDPDQIRLISSIFLKHNEEIAYGGTIDYGKSIVHPTIIVSDLTQKMNFEELFAPVIYISVYDDMSQLSQYFQHASYISNEMYVSLFGSCDYVGSLKRSIIVRDQVVFDIDRGNDEFGGYSTGASFVASNRRVTPQPILVPREIHDYLQPGSAGYKLSPSVQAKIAKQVRKAMVDFFSTNLVFGFVFGSVARQLATGSSDINTMIVLENKDIEQTQRYISWLRHQHEHHQLIFKEKLSAIILTKDELNHVVSQLDCSGKPVDLISDLNTSVFTEALSGFQSGVGGNKRLSVEYCKKVLPHSKAVQRKKPSPLIESPPEYVPKSEPMINHMKADSSSSETETSAPVTPPQIMEESKVIHNLNQSSNSTRASPRKSKWMRCLWTRIFRSKGRAKA